MDRPVPVANPRVQHAPRPGVHAARVSNPHAAAALRRQPSTPDSAASSRAAQLFDLERDGAYTASQPATAPTAKPAEGASGSAGGDNAFLDDGWGVVAVGASPAAATAKAVAKRDKKKPAQRQQPQQQDVKPRRERATAAMPFVDKSSEAGLAGLALLQMRLLQEGRVAHDEEQKARVAAEGAARRERLAKTARRKRDWVDPELLDEDEDEAEELEMNNQQQYFELNLEADGSAEVVEFDKQGREVVRRAPGAQAALPPPAPPAAAASKTSTAIPAAARSTGAAGSTATGSSASNTGSKGSRTAAPSKMAAAAAAADDDEDDPLAFLADLDDEGEDVGHQEEEEEEKQRRVASGAAAGPSRRGAAAPALPRAARPRSGGNAAALAADDDGEDGGDAYGADGRRVLMPGVDALADEEFEWGLDELHGSGQRRSLMQELGVIKSKPKKQQQEGAQGRGEQSGAAAGTAAAAGRGKQGAAAATPSTSGREPAAAGGGDAAADDFDDLNVAVAWGGSGGASGIDMEQQEALLARIFKPHKVKALMAHQRAAEAELAALKRKASGRQVLESKVHSRMRIIAGSAAGKQLASSKGSTTRPMMEKVRQAIFNMIQAQAGSGGGLPTTARWLDVFAGTGSVGLEALSRGCRECHFIELDQWVCRKVLSRNIATCGFERQAVVHTMKAEDFLRRSIQLPRFAGGAFDFLSICPPYLVVSYPELMGLLDRSPLIHERSIVFVEYPKQLAHEVPPTLGSLVTVRDRKYGRTYIRVYGPADGPAVSEEDDEFGMEEEEEEGDELLI